MITTGSIRVSVIVLTYNHERFVRQALESILAQRVNFRYEILIGDDASQDKTPEILREYRQKYPDVIRLWLREKNLGATHNAYELLMAAQGEYIAACEGDDYWIVADKLQKQVELLDANPQYIGCAHKCRIVDEDGVPLRRQRLHWISQKRVYTLRDYRGLILPGQAATIVRRNIYHDQQCDYSIFMRAHPQIGDRTTMLIYAARGDFYCLSDVMSCYRQRKRNGLTAQTYARGVETIWKDFLYTNCLDNFARNQLQIDAGFRIHKRDLLTEAICCWFRGEQAQSGWVIREIVKSEPSGWRMFGYVPLGMIKKIYSRLVLRSG